MTEGSDGGEKGLGTGGNIQPHCTDAIRTSTDSTVSQPNYVVDCFGNIKVFRMSMGIGDYRSWAYKNS